jgi:hypothetical protein
MALGLVLMLGLSGLCLSGCSSKAPGNTTGTGGTTATGNASPGTYSFTIYANDGVDLAITNGTGTAFTVTIQ